MPTICRLLNIPLYALFGMDDPNLYTGEEKTLVSDYRAMTMPNRRQLRKVADAILVSQEETRKEVIARTTASCAVTTTDWPQASADLWTKSRKPNPCSCA